jgi:hypothetical protein
MTSIYNASDVNFYNATGSPARFENKNILFYFEKRSSLLQRWRCSCKFRGRRIGSWGQCYDPYFQQFWAKKGNFLGNDVFYLLEWL